MYIYPPMLPDSIQHYIDQLHSIFREQAAYSVLIDNVAIPVDDPGVYLIPLHVTLAPPQVATQHMDVYLACQFNDIRDETDTDMTTSTIALDDVKLPSLPAKVAYQATQYSVDFSPRLKPGVLRRYLIKKYTVEDILYGIFFLSILRGKLYAQQQLYHKI